MTDSHLTPLAYLCRAEGRKLRMTEWWLRQAGRRPLFCRLFFPINGPWTEIDRRGGVWLDRKLAKWGPE